MNPTDTRVDRPFAVTRVITGRVIVEFTADGEVIVKSANGIPQARETLLPGESLTAVFTLRSKWHCGAAVFQPAGWTTGCDGEMSLTLGNVDFPYLNDSGYVAKDQLERFNEITVKLVYDKDRLGWIEGSVGEGSDFHGVKSMTPKSSAQRVGSHSVAFIAYSEVSAVSPRDMESPKLTQLLSGGDLAIQFSKLGRAAKDLAVAIA